MTNILYFDLATWTGWAYGPVSGRPAFGSWKLPSASKVGVETLGLCFKDRLIELFKDADGVDLVGFEKPMVGQQKNANGAHIAFGLAMIVGVFFLERQLPQDMLVSPHQATVKKFWTGNGRASKEMMVSEAISRGYKIQNDNEADAVAGWQHIAMEEYPEATKHLLLEGMGG